MTNPNHHRVERMHFVNMCMIGRREEAMNDRSPVASPETYDDPITEEEKADWNKRNDLPLLRAKLLTVTTERAAGRGDYDRLTELAAELREAIAEASR